MKNIKEVTKIVDAHFNSGLSLDDAAMQLTKQGVKFSEIQNTIHAVGVKNEWILTAEKLKAKVVEHVKGKTITHFLDVAKLASSLDVSSLSDSEKQKAITDFSGVSKSTVTASKKFKQFNNSGYMGEIANWIKSNPDFSHDELLNSGLIASAPHRIEYFEEFLAYQNFFSSLTA
ncbi:MAG: hypothetical protein JRJ00_00775 [Deltaproteobacteria bacterium]|nr:hypothetical protein [Deltaproteobacteria bacterium]